MGFQSYDKVVLSMLLPLLASRTSMDGPAGSQVASSGHSDTDITSSARHRGTPHRKQSKVMRQTPPAACVATLEPSRAYSDEGCAAARKKTVMEDMLCAIAQPSHLHCNLSGYFTSTLVLGYSDLYQGLSTALMYAGVD